MPVEFIFQRKFSKFNRDFCKYLPTIKTRGPNIPSPISKKVAKMIVIFLLLLPQVHTVV